MNANTQHNLPRRVIIAAALLANRYSNPDVAAYNRSNGLRSTGMIIAGKNFGVGERRKHFWFRVGRALGCMVTTCGVTTDYEWAVRSDIRRTMEIFKSA